MKSLADRLQEIRDEVWSLEKRKEELEEYIEALEEEPSETLSDK